jgi:hypothetical protein
LVDRGNYDFEVQDGYPMFCKVLLKDQAPPVEIIMKSSIIEKFKSRTGDIYVYMSTST